MPKKKDPIVQEKTKFKAPSLDELRSEEDVKIKFLLPYLEAKGYTSKCINFNVPIEVQEGRKQKTIFADAVVYSTPSKTAPLIVCETKPPTEVLSKTVKEQAISYARLLPRIAPLALITNGGQTQLFQTLSKNRIGELPDRKDLKDDFVSFVVSAELQESLKTEAKHDLFVIDDVQSFKTVLRACHEAIRNNEGFDATRAFDEMSKVLFCKMYEERNHPGDNNRFRMSIYDDTLKRLGVNVVNQIWNETKVDPRYASLFESNADVGLKPMTIRKIVEQFENFDLSLTAFDVKGEAFEYFLGETFTGGLGEYFTPRNVVEFMVDALDPKIGQKIVDPFCGTGGFLIYAFEVVGEKIRLQDFGDEEKARWKEELSNRCIYGTDWKERTALACKMNMTVHGDGSAGIFLHHGFIDVPGMIEEGLFNLCLTNPPFGSFENDPEILSRYELGAGRNSQDRVTLAIERVLRLVKPGGRVGIVVIDGLLNNDSTRYVREYIKKTAFVRGIISLPAVTFQGYHARAKTSILFLEKRANPDDSGIQEDTFFCVIGNSGYAPNGNPVPGNELPEALLDWRAFESSKPIGAHKEAWIGKIEDRMDAEFYRKRKVHVRPEEEQVVSAGQDMLAMLAMISEELAAVSSDIKTTFSSIETVSVPLSAIFEPCEEVIKVGSTTVYKLLGVKWWGAGTFLREEKTGKEIKATRLFRVHQGWLVYNRLFAFRGSFALIPPEHENCYVSSEFPTFKVRENTKEPELLANYVIHCLNSPQYLLEVDRDSTGSTKTSRNRFKEDRFLRMRVEIPRKIAHLRQLVDLLNKANVLRACQVEVAERFKRFNEDLSRLLPHEPDALTVDTSDVEVFSNRTSEEHEPKPAKITSRKKGNRKPISAKKPAAKTLPAKKSLSPKRSVEKPKPKTPRAAKPTTRKKPGPKK
ncbi:hypothetical protein GETHOR_03630 [Geothrix oryzae]|uniref:Site-specific DNA-methyltransferase (adenine-specific) n=1 Tax=Geothrix oryzae TaxID=2927975 RepID=A0ABM8DMY1_9BACT|nr:N-6 DNA methylase [Geothrix oryzae]BDU68262.1 hypothetical protein GETHOR_03630 [Geothrix oryzae]